MTTLLFLIFVTVIAALVIAMIARRTKAAGGWLLLLWLGYVGAIGYFGVIRNTALRPPGMVFLFVPVVVLLVVFIVRLRSAAGAKLATAFPLWLLIGAQSFRIIVELFIHQLWAEGLVPKMLTFSGANVDLYVGISAPLVAWISMRGNRGKTWALVWNVAGLFALANVVVRAC
jgi:hypothetical protein